MDTKLTQELAAHGFPPDLPRDGLIHRFDMASPMSGWFISRDYEIAGKSITLANYGDWATGETFTFTSEGEYTASEARKIKAELALSREKEKLARDGAGNAAAAKCYALWERCDTPTDSLPYFTKKGLPDHNYGSRVYQGDLIVPGYNIHGELRILQKISPVGDKFFAVDSIRGMQVRAAFHPLGTPTNGEDIYICEGIATAASIYDALDRKMAVVAGFCAGNLLSVAEALRTKYPESRFVVCADNDQGKEKNVGVVSATRIVSQIQNTCLIIPNGPGSDFNDLHIAKGIEEVREQLRGGVASTPELHAIEIYNAKGMPIKPAEQMVSSALHKYYTKKIYRWDTELFLQNDNYWSPIDDNSKINILTQIKTLYGMEAKSRDIDSAFMTFLRDTPRAKYNPRRLNPTMINLEDGTYHVIKENGVWSLKFFPHNPDDFLMFKLPISGRGERGLRNEEFERLVENTFTGDDDAKEKIRAIRQMYGAAILPMFPRLFLLIGNPLSGKSSLINPIRRLLDERNICGEDPTTWHREFSRVNMLDRLVNIVADINTRLPISDSDVKLIEDRVPVSVNRKFKTAVQAYLPAVHIFGANRIPPTLEGSVGAHRRRWTFIKCNREFPRGNRGLSLEIFDKCPIGVLNFALDGAEDLLANEGNFANPESGENAILQWEKSSDLVTQFLDDLRTKEFQPAGGLEFGENLRIERSALYEIFRSWCGAMSPSSKIPGKYEFLQKMQNQECTLKIIRGVRCYAGLGQIIDTKMLL